MSTTELVEEEAGGLPVGTGGGGGASSARRGAAAPPRRRRKWLAWLGAVPFLAYVALFLLIPTVEVIVNAFRGTSGSFSLANVRQLTSGQYASAYVASIKVSVATALTGGLLGFFVAWSTLQRGIPRAIRPIVTTFSGVAANFAGIPLAFAFVATLGTTGVVTVLLAHMGLNLTAAGFTLYGFSGLVVVYTYFQFPLMLLIIIPSLEGMRTEWREATASLGGGAWSFWRYVGLPILLPSIASAMVLLFGSAFSAYATPYALTSGYINLVPVLIGSVMSGNIVANPGLGDALALGMILVVSVAVAIYVVLQRRVSRWAR